MAYTIDPNAWITLDEAKDHLNIPLATTTYDDQLTRMINAATAKIETFIDRKVLKREFIEYQDGRGTSRMLLRHWPADKPSEVWVDPTGLFTDAVYELDTASYELEESADGGIGLILFSGLKFATGRRNIKIVYEAGYNPVPFDLVEACLYSVEFLYNMRSDKRVGTTQKGKNAENLQYASDLPEFIKDILVKYQRFEFPTASYGIENM